ncbi:thaumatin-like protein 1b [Cornus florida]|uniref:thaumatin-like protein 1b n=1 Tax=Cornus florida TaxID=4283 RepID=UPI00289DE25F|nr:thaumatin-like protein 1b [Cornus florida]
MEALKLFFLALFVSGAHSVTFTIKNKCPYTIWPATLTGGGKPQLSTTGFELAKGASQSIDVPAGWSGRFWARAWCSKDAAGKFSCRVADCASGQVGCNGAGAIPPATLAEFTLNGHGGQDFYDVSLVDGFNLPVAITPQPGKNCPATACPVDVNAKCPRGLSIKNADGRGTIGCKSACLAFNTPEFCCSGNFATPQTCKPSKYAKLFKRSCPQAYSYAYDDTSSTFICGAGGGYDITFCP